MKRSFIQKVSLIISDVLSLFLSLVLVVWLLNWVRPGTAHVVLNNLGVAKLAGLLLIVVFWYQEQYVKRRPVWEEIRLTCTTILVFSLFHLGASYLVSHHVVKILNVLFWICLIFVLPMLRCLVKQILIKLNLWQRDLYIIGFDDNAMATYQLLLANKILGYRFLGFINLDHVIAPVDAVIIDGTRIGYVRENISRAFLDKYVIYNNINRYHSLYYLDLIQALGYQPNYSDLNLDFFNNPVTESTKKFLLKNQLSNYIVVINSGGNNAFEQSGIRMLPYNKIIELLNNLLKTHTVILMGGNIDKHNYDFYIKTINNPNLYNMAGIINLSDSAHILKHATKIYTTDCGAMHLALSQRCQNKMICFFGPTNPNHVLPANQGITVYWDDQDIYDPNYALKGRTSQKNLKYFTKLDLTNICNL